MADYSSLPISEIRPSPWNTRFEVDVDLSDSLKAVGQVQPLKVRPVKDGYELVSGHRRLASMKKAGIVFADCVVEELSDKEVLLEQWAENEDRRELSDYEKALKLRQMLDAFKMTQEDLAKKTGKSQPWISYHLSMLRLEEFITPVIISKLSEFQARVILSAPEKILPDVCAEIERYYKAEKILPSAGDIMDLINGYKAEEYRRKFLYEQREQVLHASDAPNASMKALIEAELGPKPDRGLSPTPEEGEEEPHDKEPPVTEDDKAILAKIREGSGTQEAGNNRLPLSTPQDTIKLLQGQFKEELTEDFIIGQLQRRHALTEEEARAELRIFQDKPTETTPAKERQTDIDSPGIEEYMARSCRRDLTRAIVDALEDNRDKDTPSGKDQLAARTGVETRTVERWLTGDIQSCNINASQLVDTGLELCPQETMHILNEDLNRHASLLREIKARTERQGAVATAVEATS
jgi:ParB/RepB/Spo0J family partition protein